jgi:uncharacterized protein (TIGR03086 family)
MDATIARHRVACDGFARIAHAVPAGRWADPTPCTEWNTRDLVEHVIGFHEVLLLRPLARSAQRPRTDIPARWDVTSTAIFAALATVEGRELAEPFLAALTIDVLVHTWDLGRGAGVPVVLDPELCAISYDTVTRTEMARGEMIAPAVAVPDDADVATRLVAYYGRDPNAALRP